MLRLRRPSGAALAAIVVVLSAVSVLAASLPGCGDSPPGDIQCLESIAPTSGAIAAGSSSTFTVSLANPDDDDGTAVVVVWMLSGGGTLDQSETTLSLTDQTDPYGNPLGTAGTSSNTVNAVGPAGTYTLQASTLEGGGCVAQTLPPVSIQITGELLADGGAGDAASDAADAAEAAGDATPDVEDSADSAADATPDAPDGE